MGRVDVSGMARATVSNISSPKRKVVIALNTAWNLINFRAGLIQALVAQGYEVVAVAPNDSYTPRLTELGCRFIELPMDNQGTHPGRDALLLWRYWRLLANERPDVYLGYTVKPNVYGSLAAHWLNIPVVNNIAGLGSVFIRDSWLLRVVRELYRVALARSVRVFFQNNDDRQLFIRAGLVRPEITDILPGSGVDLVRFALDRPPTHQPNIIVTGYGSSESLTEPALPGFVHNNEKYFRFLLIARMLWDKGVGEYVTAARLIRLRWPQVECCLLGFLDVKNSGAISRTQMDDLVAQGVIYLGVSDDVRVEIAEADCIVLPSYYPEGTPRALLEAAAMGKPIITTDTVGCREVVDDSINGYLCQARDSTDLAEKMDKMLQLTPEQRQQMGVYGRQKIEREFDEKIVINKYLAILDVIFSTK
jgi:glycosyltransferase involved in cell wall biosynthesis